MEFTKIKRASGTIKLLDDDRYRLILTKEIVDRDGEVVSVKGINISEDSIPLIDAHNSRGSVIQNTLGKVKEFTKDIIDGTPVLTGVATFAPSPAGDIAKALVKGGFSTKVSIGFGVKSYDDSTKTIEESELYEVSMVTIPANQAATFIKGLKDDEVPNELLTRLKNHAEIHPKIKAYRKAVKSLHSLLGFEPSGNELEDLEQISELISSKLSDVETLQKKVSTFENQEYLTMAQLEEIIEEIV